MLQADTGTHTRLTRMYAYASTNTCLYGYKMRAPVCRYERRTVYACCLYEIHIKACRYMLVHEATHNTVIRTYVFVFVDRIFKKKSNKDLIPKNLTWKCFCFSCHYHHLLSSLSLSPITIITIFYPPHHYILSSSYTIF